MTGKLSFRHIYNDIYNFADELEELSDDLYALRRSAYRDNSEFQTKRGIEEAIDTVDELYDDVIDYAALIGRALREERGE